MPTDIVIPSVGESVTEGVIAAWLKNDGDWVERDETVLELETDKITVELPAPASGIIKQGATEGDTVDVGATVGSIDESATKPVSSAGAAQKAESAQADKTATATAPPPTQSQPKAQPPPAKPQASPNSNGDLRATRATSVRCLLDELGVTRARIAVELNCEMLPRERHDSTVLRDGDQLEVVSFVGGG